MSHMKGFDLGSSAVNLRAPGSSHRLARGLNVPVDGGLILTSGDGVLLQRHDEGNDEFV